MAIVCGRDPVTIGGGGRPGPLPTVAGVRGRIRHDDPGLGGLSFGYTYLGIFGIGALGAAIPRVDGMGMWRALRRPWNLN